MKMGETVAAEPNLRARSGVKRWGDVGRLFASTFLVLILSSCQFDMDSTIADTVHPPQCAPGAQKDADDGCNTCECSEMLQWACTELECEDPIEAVCAMGTHQYALGESANGDGENWCNTCTCLDDGSWACDDAVCTNDCEPGEQRDADDGCNVCACTSRHTWACTEESCEDPVDVVCVQGDRAYAPGESANGDGENWCNTCTCLDDGSWACDDAVCTNDCEPGEQRDADDGCNTCECTNDHTWACTEESCEEPVEVLCVKGDRQYAPGEAARGDGENWCNTCTCLDDGSWACDGEVCTNDCEPGEQRDAEDGCNTCECTGRHTWACTEMACPSLDCEPGATQTGEDGCSNCVCASNGSWRCDDSACPEHCDGGQQWTECGSLCPPTCDGPSTVCDAACVAKCECPPEARVFYEGRCIPETLCPQPDWECNPGEVKTDDDTCSNCRCSEDGSWVCRTSACDDPVCEGGQRWNTCASECTKTCDTPLPACTKRCVQACECPPETPLWENGACIQPSECPPPSPVCVVDDQEYAPGDAIPGTDANWCLYCLCEADGTVSCPSAECPVRCDPQTCGPAPAIPDVLCHDGTLAGVGECGPTNDGGCAWEITECPADTYAGAADAEASAPCTTGDTRHNEDGCSTCVCSADGSWLCDASDCPPLCEGGQEWNACGSACTKTCDKSVKACTMQCVPKCECPAHSPIFHKGNCVTKSACLKKSEKCTEGDQKDIGDECNTCTCEDGAWLCTDAFCEGSCKGNEECADKEFCQFPPGSCEAPYGKCASVPESCTDDPKPQCGCDGKDYGNACEAHAEGVNVARGGLCKSEDKECPDGSPVVNCLMDPCDTATCDAQPDALCKANYCGGCNAIFYTPNGEKVRCDGSEVEACEDGKVFTLCGSGCTKTCGDPSPECTTECVEQCQCPKGKPIWHEGKCVPLKHCPNSESSCVFGDHEYSIGEPMPPPADKPGCAICKCEDGGKRKCDFSECSTCENDHQCPDAHWCRPTMNDGTECVPYQKEGEACGGHTPLWYLLKCGPNLVCGAFDPGIADLPGRCLAQSEPVVCRRGDHKYQPGDTFPRGGNDGCNTCTCLEDGSWACDDATCPPACEPGDKRDADDGCNTCMCTEDRSWACTEMGCPPVECEPGDTRADEDGCSSCVCTPSGAWKCDVSACPKPCKGGQQWTECGSHCTPTCEGPTAICDGACVAKCECPPEARLLYKGKCIPEDRCPQDPAQCTPGEKKADSDTCSSCRCAEDGSWTCNTSDCGEPLCEGGQRWNTCASACTKTCDDPLPACTRQCVQACECPPKAPLWENGACVQKSECPSTTPVCVVGDLEYAAGDTIPGTGADWCVSCRCEADGTVSCPSIECPVHCDALACGPAPSMPNILCADGVTMAGVGKCVSTTTGKCAWEILECSPDTACTPGDTRDSEKSCGSCVCSDDGTWSCDASECPAPCKGGQKWNSCGSACTQTCDDPVPFCTYQCVPKCECPADLPVFHEGHCVKQSACIEEPGECTEGEIKEADDNCNTCTCKDDVWRCSHTLCETTCKGSAECGDEEFCQFPDGACEDTYGKCAPVPDACTEHRAPQCGCDGKDYGNACEAYAEGVSVARNGLCNPDPDQCPNGSSPVSCLMDPCNTATCEAHPNASCKANYCGGCNAVFYSSSGERVRCDKPEVEPCEDGKAFTRCGSRCTKTCGNPAPMCITQCFEKCQCPEDHPIWHEGECIPLEGCPEVESTCVLGDREYEIGETMSPPAGVGECAICKCGEGGERKCDLSDCSTCDTDDQCPSTHWCRVTINEDKECVPYQEEGDTCGGFTPIWSVRRCGPNLVCGGFHPLIPDMPGRCLAEGEPAVCLHNDHEYKPGDTFPGEGYAWCTTCSCLETGSVVCTLMGCPSFCENDDECPSTHWCRSAEPSGCPDDAPGCKACTPFAQPGEHCGGYVPAHSRMQCAPDLECVHEPNQPSDLPGTCELPTPGLCVPGTLDVAEDGCNDCLCLENGTWHCNDTACTSDCEQGEHKVSHDGCNQCSCFTSSATGVGLWACTKMACNGCTPGESKLASDGCNTCMCVPRGTSPASDSATTAPNKAGSDGTSTSACNDCLANGGTWQPEANTCTTNCDIQDISCYTEVCPKPEGNSGPWLCTDLPRCEPQDCPAPEPFNGSCAQVISWAKNPASGKCCSYPNPCVVPESMGETYGSKRACQKPGTPGVGGSPFY